MQRLHKLYFLSVKLKINALSSKQIKVPKLQTQQQRILHYCTFCLTLPFQTPLPSLHISHKPSLTCNTIRDVFPCLTQGKKLDEILKD